MTLCVKVQELHSENQNSRKGDIDWFQAPVHRWRFAGSERQSQDFSPTCPECICSEPSKGMANWPSVPGHSLLRTVKPALTNLDNCFILPRTYCKHIHEAHPLQFQVFSTLIKEASLIALSNITFHILPLRRLTCL